MENTDSKVKKVETEWIASHLIVCDLERLAVDFLLAGDDEGFHRTQLQLQEAIDMRGNAAAMFLNATLTNRYPYFNKYL